LFEHLMHSWVGYELVKVLFKYGLSPKIRSDLNDWSEKLYKLFSYFGTKKRDSTKRPTELLDVLFEKTEHCSYFEKLPFGKKTKFEKMSNTTLALVIMTWLRQLQEHFYEQAEIKPSIDWNDLGRYCNVPYRYAVEKGVSNVHMAKANSTTAAQIETFDNIKPNKKNSTTVVKSLFEWAERILYRENDYVDELTNSIERGKKSMPPKYEMTDKNYQQSTLNVTTNKDIDTFTPEDQQSKTPAQLMSVVSSFMTNEIERLQKMTGQKKASQKNIDLINDTNRAAACLVEYVNKVEKKEFTSLEEMKTHMAKEAESHNGANDGDTSEAEYDDENALEEALRETADPIPFRGGEAWQNDPVDRNK